MAHYSVSVRSPMILASCACVLPTTARGLYNTDCSPAAADSALFSLVSIGFASASSGAPPGSSGLSLGTC